MKKLLQVLAIFYLTMFCATPTMGQNINWVKTAGGTKNDHGRAIQVDAAGNIYVVGFFSNPSALFGTTTLSTPGTGTYLTKYSNTGNFAWARKISDTNVTNGHGLKTDAAGNSYVVTTFTGSVSLGSTTLSSSGSSDIVVAKYNTNGTVVWAAKAGGASADNGESITIDAAGNSYITGSFAGTATFGSTSLNARGQDVFVAMLRTDGSFVWARNAGSMGADEGRSIATDGNGNVYVAGNYTGSASFGSTTLTSKGGQDIFLASFDSNGTLQWATSAGGTNSDVVTSLDIDASGNLYLGGHFTGTSTFGSTQLRTNGNNQDIFLARYTSSGANTWAKSISSNGTEELNGLSVNADGDIYLTGSFSSSLRVGNFNFSTTGLLDIYAAHYLSDGTPQWLIGAGSGVDDRGFGIVSDASKNVYVTGYFQGATTSFGGIPIPNRGGEETFISKLDPFLTTTSVTTGPYCAGQTVTVRYQTTSILGRDYHAELSDANGSFASPVKIGSIHFNGNTGSISATIPANTPAGSKYRIRVVATNPGFVGSDNGADLIIKPTPPVPELTATSPSAGGTLYLSATEIPGATYSWTGPNGFSSNLREPSRANIRTSDAGTYNLTVNVNGCISTASIAVALSNVPTYDVDLSGDPNGVYTSEPLKRGGSNCGGDNCIQFNIRLHKDAGQIEVTVDGGSGSMKYIINCDAANPKNANEPVCIVNTGILTITSCKPGGNANRYTIRSIAAFEPQADVSLTAGCSDILRAPATFNEADIVWEDLTGGGAYLKYLSFPNGKKNAVVTGDDDAPAYVDYRVRGTSIRTTCAPTLYYDDIRVYFFPKPVVTVGPTPAIICPGGSGVLLSGNVTGGDGEFEYVWTNAAGVQVGNKLNYTATAVGTYTLKAIPKNSKDCEDFTATIDVVSDLTANAGSDQQVCSQSPVQLAGVITAATGGVWSGGGGTFSPSNTALNAVYTPTATEIAAGSVRLTLTSTGNGSCTAVKDDVLITFYPIDVELTGTPVICNGTLGTISAKVTGGKGSISYKWSSGQTTATITGVAAGTYTVTVSDGKGCAITKSFTVTQVNGPTDFTLSATQETCGRSDGSVTISSVVGGTAGYKYSADGKTYQTGTTLSNLAAGTYTIYVMDANGCTVSKSVTITNVAGPTAVAASSVAASCKNNDGGITVGQVSGGTAPYKYSINGSTFQDANTFTGLAAGTYTVTAQDKNGCTVTRTVTVAQETLTAFTATPASSTCGNSNASITVSNVQGGVAPLYYSVDGVNFETNATLSGLTAGNYTVTVRDARGCSLTKAVTVGNIAGPTDLTVSAKASSCGYSNAEVTVTNVSGGTGTYTYSIDGTNFQASATFTGLAAGNYTVYVKDGNGCIYSEAVVLTDMAGPAFTATAKASTCGASNGSITVSAPAAGYAPYTYALNGGSFQSGSTFTSLKAGEYKVTVKDANGCESIQTVEVTDIAGPSDFVLTATPSTCGASNGSLTVSNVTGGTSAYTYSIDGKTFQASATFANLLAREYTITVKDRNNCVISKKITLTNVAGPTNITASAKASTCGSNNGELTVTGVTGGTAPYTYSKDGVNFQASATLTGFVAGTHTITVKDANGCTFSSAFAVTDIAGPTAVAATAQPAGCANDGSITVGRVTGGTAGYTYSIDGVNFQASTTFNGLASGTYTVRAKDANGCVVTRSVTVGKTVPTNFAATTEPSTCGSNNGTIIVGAVTGGVGPYEYSKDGVNFQASATLNGFVAGAHTITVKDAKGCTFSKAITVTDVAGPSDLTATATASTCGNPNGQLSVSGVTGGTSPYTYSIDGANFQNSGTFTVLAEGTYTVYVKDANGCTYSEKVAVSNIAGPSFTLTAKASTCGARNGSITVNSPTGGKAPYTYALNNGNFQASATFSGLAAAEYSITVKDANGCELTQKIVVTDIAGPNDVALASTASTCGDSNGTIRVAGVTDGTAPYAYSIDGKNFQESQVFGAVLAGKYTLSVRDANGCTFTKEIVVDNVAGPTALTASAKASTCGRADGEVTITGVTGGTGAYKYSKDGVNYQTSATLTGFAAGTHTVYAMDENKCVVSASVTVSNINGPTAVAATSLPASCQNNDGSITVGRVTGGTADYTYSINGTTFQSSTTFTGLAAGTYTLTAKDKNGCTVTASVVVRTNVPTAFASNTIAATCGRPDGQITVGVVTGGTGPYKYSINGGAFQTSATFTGLVADTYKITVQDAKGCTFTSEVGIANLEGPTFTATAKATTCGDSNGSITVSNVSGGAGGYGYSINGGPFQESAAFGRLSAGTYTIAVRDMKGCVGTRTVVVDDVAGPSDMTLAAKASTCGAANATITVSNVVGGTSGYTYSIDGKNFQTSATFANLAAGEYTITVKDKNGCTLARTIDVTDIPGPSELQLASTPSTCGENNGKIEVSGVTGGTASYTFSIDGKTFQQGTTFAGVKAGEYTVTVKDANGCILEKKVVVENTGGPTGLLASATSSTCGAANGKLTVTGATGGVAPYTYSIDGVNFQAGLVFENLLAGEHTLTVKDKNGCTFARTFSVADIAGPSAVAATSLPASCQNNDGSITVGQVTGGTAGYTYSIDGRNFQASTSFTGLASGDYTVTVKDKNGCTVTTSIKVNQNVPTDFASTTVASTCGAGNASITVGAVTGGTAPYMYSLNGGSFQTSATFANLAAGTYNITVRDAKGCTFRKEVEVEDIAGPSALALTGKSSTCGSPNASITVSGVTGGTAPYTFSLNNAAFQSSTSFGSLAAGKYEITVKDANGCTFTQAITLENIPGPSAFTATASASSCGRANGSIKVDAVTGGTAPYTYSADGTNFQEAATLTGLLAGEHTITVKDANNCIITMKVVVEDVAGPSGLELASTASTCGDRNGSITVGRVTGGTAPYKYSLDGVNFQNGLTFEGVLAGAYTITVEDAKGCTFSASIKVDNIGGPTDFVATAKASTCGASNGEVSISSVSGGTGSYTYSIDGATFQASATFAGLAAGFHTITVKDANGCTFTKAVEVTNMAGPSAIAATTKAASCADNDGSLTVTRVIGGTSAYTYSIDGKNFQSAATFSGLASGEYTITVRDANGCEFSEKVQVSKDGPASFASTTVSASCGDANGRITIASVDGGVGPYSYSINGGNFQASASFTALAAGAYTITVKDANQCTYSGQVMVGNVDGPSDLVATATNTTCGNSNGQISITGVTGGTKPYAYSIDGNNFQEAAAFTGVAAGEYLVTVKDAKGCLFVKPITVSNITGPEGFAFATKASTCGSSNGEVTVTNVTGGTAPYTYSADGKTFQADAKLTGLAAGSHTITIKDANGCTFTRTAEVGNISGPEKYELATVATTCGAANGSITVSKVTGGTAPYTYALNNGSFQAAATFANVAAGEYTIRVKDANGCILEKKVVVSDIAGPSDIAASTTPTACTANNGTITVSGVTGGKAPYTYSLDGKTYQAAGNFGSLAAGEYDLYVKDANGCSTTVKVTVGIKGPKEAEVAATNATCGEDNGTITVTAVKEGTKPLAYSIDGKNFQTSATFGNLAVGVYTITIKDAEGCVLEVTKEVSNSGAPTFTATGTDASCGASNGRIVISNVGGGVSPYTYSIDGTTFQNAPEFTGLAEGEYPVTVKGAAGCVSIEVLTIRNTPPITNLSATVNSPTCEQPAGSISIDEVVGGTAPYTYSLDGATFTAAATLTDVAPGTYTLTVKDAAGCTYSIEVQVEEGVSSKLDYVHHLACSGGNTGEIVFASTGADAQTQYSIDGGKTFQKSPVFKELAKGTYQLITKFSEACTINVGTVEVKEAEVMLAEVTPLTKAVGLEKTGSAAVTKITGGVGPYTYSLDGGSFTSDSVFTNLSAREYTLTVKDSRGCMTTATFVIEGLGDIDIPNGFTPNGDGMNDTWVLKNLPNLYPNCQVTVYNRWGSEVFSSKGYKRPWDGTYKGKRLPDGTYYTIIEFGDGTAPIKTSVTIMR
ncbi:T9SS type B sorting domain-containing protein [Pontibacter chinhatensis]|uniref:Gliding motility-associated C-terminal domain-containing protein n=1 Tax=Pontibacter chinhatensis TaxID=1436961 RepID=A0A1I2YFC0_9BACT|nr:gliding motility-associated C-terminal domain-containing protein [Pontibacter chinhatensis]SFH24353.1 gliding motility-associated C-terminal domain-containing protein [Pontibacter chinhatensis]